MKGKILKKRKWSISIGVIFACGIAAIGMANDSTSAVLQVPTPGLVTMVDLGAHKCIPCKMMAPIIAELKKEYAGRASIIFIDVWELPEQAKRFGIRGIPTQIFYDKEGREVGRHMGFLDKKSIVAAFEKMGVPKKAGQ